jgi:acyl carrier protein
MNERERIFDRLAVLLQPFNRDHGEITMRTDIAGDLKLDSVTVMDFVMEIEDSFDIEIPLNVLSEIRTMEELVEVVEARTKRSELA